jgi:rod shape-determining protein MreC
MKLIRYLLFPNKSLALLLLYVFLSGVMMNFSEPSALRGIRWAMLQVTETLSSLQNRFAIRNDLEQRNQFLVRENFELRVRGQELREMVLENARLKQLLALKDKAPRDFITARVIAWGTENGVGSVILDVGEDDGVLNNMGVLNAQGLVGKVFQVSPSQCQVQLLQDRNAFVSARLQNTREIGTVAWRGGSFLEMQHILKNIPVDVGEVVLSSGLGKIYPPDIKIGVVASVEADERGMFHTIKVQPAVDFNALEEVFVIRELTRETESE